MNHLQENIDKHEMFIKTMGYSCRVKRTLKGDVKGIIIDNVVLDQWNTTQKLLRLGFDVADNAYKVNKAMSKKIKVFQPGEIV